MMRALLSALRQDEQGAALIELAFAAPILTVLLMGATDVGLAFSRKLALEQGAQRAVEKVMQTTQLDTVEGTIANEVAEQADVDPSHVTVTYPKYCDDRMLPFKDGLPDGDCNSTEVPSLYIQVVVYDDYEPLFSSVNLGTKLANGKYRIVAKAGMRTK